jgi:hypothetical protein
MKPFISAVLLILAATPASAASLEAVSTETDPTPANVAAAVLRAVPAGTRFDRMLSQLKARGILCKSVFGGRVDKEHLFVARIPAGGGPHALPRVTVLLLVFVNEEKLVRFVAMECPAKDELLDKILSQPDE